MGTEYLSYIYDSDSETFVNIGGSNYTKIYYATTAEWNASHEISKKQALYVYSDAIRESDGNGNERLMPKFKIGDGLAYVVDLPFVGDEISATLALHISDTDSHILAAERIRWNNKCRVDESDLPNENLIFTTN